MIVENYYSMLEIFVIIFLLAIFFKMFASMKNKNNHFYSFFLFRNHENKLCYHIAKKKIPSIGKDGQRIDKPTEINGIKLEKFVFDVFACAK